MPPAGWSSLSLMVESKTTKRKKKFFLLLQASTGSIFLETNCCYEEKIRIFLCLGLKYWQGSGGKGWRAVGKCSSFSVELLNHASERYVDGESGNQHPDGKSK